MTLTLELPPALEERLRERADREGLALADLAQEMLAELMLTTEEQAAEDAADNAAADEALANGDLSDCYTLDDLRQALGRPARGESIAAGESVAT